MIRAVYFIVGTTFQRVGILAERASAIEIGQSEIDFVSAQGFDKEVVGEQPLSPKILQKLPTTG